MPAAAPQGWRKRIYLILEGGPAGGLPGQIVEAGLIFLILANVIAYVLESVPSFGRPYWFDLGLFEAVSVAIFTVEYALRLWSAQENPEFHRMGPWRGRLAAACRPLLAIDFLAVAPCYLSLIFPILDLRFLRMIRLFRLFKIARYSPALATLGEVIVREKRALFGTLMLVLCATVFSAAAIHAAEGDVQPELFGSIPMAMWWAITTLTTVGYGDITPVTPIGRLIASATMVTGLGILALPAGIVATSFIETIHRRDFVVTFGILARVPLFRDFDARFLAMVMNLLRAQTVNRGDLIAVRGAPAEAMYFVVSGEVEASIARKRRHFGPGDYFGEQALLHGSLRSATFYAVTHTRLLSLGAEDFTMLLDESPKLRRRIEEASCRGGTGGKADDAVTDPD